MPFNSDTAKQARAKSSANLGGSKLKRLFLDYADADDVKELFEVLKAKAMEGDLEAVKIMLGYLIGKPTENVKMDVEGGITVVMRPVHGYENKNG
jgi:hypothetical protein